MLLMKQIAKIISTYTADVSGVCSALFELGGMTIMHDASGCNSTYSTHDEPRWYDADSMIYVSGLSEMEAVMGDDEKLITDIVSAANELHPDFIAIAGTTIPMMIGTDFQAISAIVEKRTNIPAFGFKTNGMHSYISGAGMAFEVLAKHMIPEKDAQNIPQDTAHDHIGVNILGLTPLDFAINGTDWSIRNQLEMNDFTVIRLTGNAFFYGTDPPICSCRCQSCCVLLWASCCQSLKRTLWYSLCCRNTDWGYADNSDS